MSTLTANRELVNGQFEDCTDELLPEEELESSNVEDDQDMPQNSKQM